MCAYMPWSALACGDADPVMLPDHMYGCTSPTRMFSTTFMQLPCILAALSAALLEIDSEVSRRCNHQQEAAAVTRLASFAIQVLW